MNYILVVFASATTANRVKSILSKRYAIESRLIQTPKTLPGVSCSYCLHMEQRYSDVVWKIITENSLTSKGIYRDGDYIKIK